ncbi:MAG: sulfatase-like hydrolase/transferase [Candidatus Omnitrophica bacterium]|nr:sulfatase-like hydrolase/transferase [Candidatus Omnitrophota bacterium]
MEKPNILLVTTDQQRFDTCGPEAPSFMRTPHFNLLCQEGIRFTRAYADCPICVPARVSIMSGKYVFNHGMWGNGRTSEVLGREDTLPARLRHLGYQTAAIGKMHFSPQRTRHGFDEMTLPEDYYRWIRKANFPYQPMRHGLGQNEVYPTMATVPESLTLTSWIAEQCLEYILERRDPTVPFFLWCSFSKPHPPFDPPEPYYSMYRNCPIPDPVYGDWSEPERSPVAFRRTKEALDYDLLPREIVREARAAYYGLITQIDYNLGRILSALQDLGLLWNTLILFTSDHGEYLGDHYAFSKIFFHEVSARVPFVLRLPKTWDNRCFGHEVRNLVTHADILPTLVAAAGGEIPEDSDGLDLVRLARGEIKSRPYLEGGAFGGRCYTAITDGRWKYIYYPEGGVEQFFDLKNDPKELRNLADLPEFKVEKENLKRELIRKHQVRNSPLVSQEDFVLLPAGPATPAEHRNNAWPGFHTEYFSGDVRH